jgi:hypothetical protein
MTIILCMPRVLGWVRCMHECPNCDTLRRYVRSVEPWHDSDWICCHCGHSELTWDVDPERALRAKQLWRDAPPADETWAKLEAEMAEYYEGAPTDEELDEWNLS